METVAVIISMIVMFLWLRTEGNADRRHLSQVQREDRKDLLELISAIKDDVLAIKEEVKVIHMEMKDFHVRLCAIEERNKR